MHALVNGRIYSGYQILDNHALVIEQDKIVAICPYPQLAREIHQQDVAGSLIVPGFIDLQLNGCGGVQFNDSLDALSIETLSTMQTTNQRYGCTSFLPTLITSSDKMMTKAVEVMSEWLTYSPNQALGLHLEGPWLNKAKRGTHNADYIRSPTAEMVNFLCQHASVISQITLAPEVVPLTIIQQLAAAGIRLAAGHSMATYTEANEGFKAGISAVTHLYNAMSTVNAREPGLVGALFDQSEIYCGIIADGHHVHDANIKAAKRIKGERLLLVTDATAPAGAAITEFCFAGKRIRYHQGRCIDEHGVLSGSALTMIDAVRHCVEFVDISLDEALRMAALYPARAIGIDHRLGSLEIGKVANFVLLDKKLAVVATFVNGKEVYRAT